MAGGIPRTPDDTAAPSDIFAVSELDQNIAADLAMMDQEASSRPATYSLLFDDELESLPNLEFDIDGILPRGGLGIVFGAPGSTKSFLALAWAMHIATGQSWCGRTVRRGPVVYVYSEGRTGLKQRVASLRDHLGITGRAGVAFLPQCLQLLNLEESIAPFADAIEAQQTNPSVIVIDTLSRNAAGADENAQNDTSRIIYACDYLRSHFNCTVVLVHHSRKGDDVLRGSSTLTGASDVIVLVKKEGDVVTLKCEKQKDADEFESIQLRLVEVGDSCILQPALLQDADKKLTGLQRHVLQVLDEIATSEGCSATTWMRSATEGGKAAERTFYGAKKYLVASGYVSMVHGSKKFTVSPEGRELLQLQIHCKTTAMQQNGSTASTAGGHVVPPACSAALHRSLEQLGIEERESLRRRESAA